MTVVKVGGSLFDWAEFPARLAAMFDARKVAHPEERLVLIAGGGPAADFVRAIDRVHGLGERTSDRLALHAMDFTSQILSMVVPGTVAIDDLEMIGEVWARGELPVLAPRHTLAEAARSGQISLPASWDVTSDTISAWIAVHAKADRLVLIKSTPLPPGATRLEAAELGLVDPMFPIVSQPLGRIEYLNLREKALQPQPLP